MDTGRTIKESLEGVGYRFSRGAVTKYSHRLQYILVRLQKQEVEASESSEEGDASQMLPYQSSLFSLRVNTNLSLVPHTDRVVSS